MDLRELTPELAKKAKEELFEDSQRIPQDLQIIKDWILKQPHLNARLDNQWLIGFLRGCKYSLERTKEKLDMYYTMRTAAPEFCSIADPMDPKIQEILCLGVAVVLPKTIKPDDPKVVLIRPGMYDPDKVSVFDIMRINHMFSCITVMDDDQSIIAGQRFVLDLDNVTMSHFTQMTPSLVKKMVMSTQEAVPIRQKGNHYINTPPGAETVFTIFRRFMNEKNKNRIFVHNKDMEALYKFVPKSLLPTEYGGDAGPIQDMIDYGKKEMESKRDWLLEEMKYKSDESKRPGKPKTVESLFGFEGSFRQLNVD